VIIGSSTGGPPALRQLLASAREDFPVPVVIVQHIPPRFSAALAEGLDECTSLQVKEAENGEIVAPGRVYVAPGGKHLLIDGTSSRLKRFLLIEERKKRLFMPSIDVTAISAVSAYGGNTACVILSGMSTGDDGLRGAEIVKAVNGLLIVQSPSTCSLPGMPRAVIEKDLPDAVLPPQRILAYVDEKLGLNKSPVD